SRKWRWNVPRFAPPRAPAPMRNPAPPSNPGFWRSMTRAQRRENLETLNDDQLRFLRDDWVWTVARREQLAPQGDWRIWLYLGGRGAGKTRSGAQWIAEGVDSGAMQRIGLIGATHQDARAVMIEGVSGLLRAAPNARYEPANQRVLFPNGA